MRYDKKALKRLMVERGLSERAVCQLSRLAPRTVYYIARGMVAPRADTLAKLAGALDVGVEVFFVRKESAA